MDERMAKELNMLLQDCTICPRRCHVDRTTGRTGFCGLLDRPVISRAALHFWEEPCISGTKGSGTVFFAGCNLHCIYCQNHDIACLPINNSNNKLSGSKEGSTPTGEASPKAVGKEVTSEHLAEIFLSLQAQGANNINLVTPTPSVISIIPALEMAKEKGLQIPIVYNTGGYETLETLKLLDGLVDIYLPDFKYFDPKLAKEYSYAEDYYETASLAIQEMFRQVGSPVLTEIDGQLLMKKGVIVRHLLLPGETRNAKKILRHLKENFGDNIYISLMSQYTPLSHVENHPKLNHTVSKEEYAKMIDFCEKLQLQNVYIQEGECAKESFIPPFDETGVDW